MITQPQRTDSGLLHPALADNSPAVVNFKDSPTGGTGNLSLRKAGE